VRTTVEDLEDNRVKLSVEVDADEFEVEVDKAFKKIAREVNLPGFRKGKVPRRVLEARFGPEIARGQALEDSIPEFFMTALSEHEIDLISPPEYEITSGEAEGPLVFDAVVAVRPTVEIVGYQGIKVEVPNLEPSSEQIDERIDAFRGQFAELASVERAAADGDTVTVDITTIYEGEEVDGLTANDYSYRVGSGGVVAELDDNLVDASVGDTLEFTAEHPAPDEEGELSFSVEVKDVQEQVLPEFTDDLVADASDFETTADFRADVEKQLRDAKLQEANNAWRSKSADQLGELIDVEVPEALVDTEVRYRVEDMAQRLSQSGIGFETYLQMIGQSVEDMIDQMREPAASAVKVDMALRALAIAEGLEATDTDVDEEFDQMAEASGATVEDLRTQISTPNQLMLLRADISKRKAADWLLENVEIVDEDGNPVEREALHIEPHDDDHDHDHDHDASHEPADEEE